MKRSKMIREILKVLKEWDGCKLETRTAKAVLDKVEHLGMIPPYVEYIFQKNAKVYIDASGREWENEKS